MNLYAYVTYSIENHANGMGSSLTDSDIHKPVTCFAVCDNFCGRFLVDHLCEGYVQCRPLLPFFTYSS